MWLLCGRIFFYFAPSSDPNSLCPPIIRYARRQFIPIIFSYHFISLLIAVSLCPYKTKRQNKFSPPKKTLAVKAGIFLLVLSSGIVNWFHTIYGLVGFANPCPRSPKGAMFLIRAILLRSFAEPVYSFVPSVLPNIKKGIPLSIPFYIGRNSGIRTHDLSPPRRTRYQAALYSETDMLICQKK